MKEERFLIIAETFRSFQMEGQTIGKRALFVRLAGCNLLCKSESWICDTIEVWKKGTKTLFKDILSDIDLDYLANGAHLIFTGGEPLKQQKKIVDFIWYLRSVKNLRPTIEVETNGTVVPVTGLIHYTDYWNVSPKLANSGESKEQRFNQKAINVLTACPNAIFKFVVEKRSDIGELIIDYRPLMSEKQIYLMGAGASREELHKVEEQVAAIALEYNWNYSTRGHIHIWNQKTGV